MEKRLQLWSPVWGWLATKEGESVDLKGQDLVLYETAIQEALEQEKLYYRKKSAPFNLMDYYDADDSVKEKVQNLDIQVKKEQDGLGYVPICPRFGFLPFLDEGEAEDLQAYNRMSHLILKRCRMVVVCGKEVTGTMNTDISTADRLHIICTTLDGLIKIKEKEA